MSLYKHAAFVGVDATSPLIKKGPQATEDVHYSPLTYVPLIIAAFLMVLDIYLGFCNDDPVSKRVCSHRDLGNTIYKVMMWSAALASGVEAGSIALTLLAHKKDQERNQLREKLAATKELKTPAQQKEEPAQDVPPLEGSPFLLGKLLSPTMMSGVVRLVTPLAKVAGFIGFGSWLDDLEERTYLPPKVSAEQLRSFYMALEEIFVAGCVTGTSIQSTGLSGKMKFRYLIVQIVMAYTRLICDIQHKAWIKQHLRIQRKIQNLLPKLEALKTTNIYIEGDTEGTPKKEFANKLNKLIKILREMQQRPLGDQPLISVEELQTIMDQLEAFTNTTEASLSSLLWEIKEWDQFIEALTRFDQGEFGKTTLRSNDQKVKLSGAEHIFKQCYPPSVFMTAGGYTAFGLVLVNQFIPKLIAQSTGTQGAKLATTIFNGICLGFGFLVPFADASKAAQAYATPDLESKFGKLPIGKHVGADWVVTSTPDVDAAMGTGQSIALLDDATQEATMLQLAMTTSVIARGLVFGKRRIAHIKKAQREITQLRGQLNPIYE